MSSGKQPEPRRHHYVPRCWLAGFTDTGDQRRDFWEICEGRYQMRPTILTSQLPVSRWHEQIGDPTLADGILNRLVHDALASKCAAIRWAKINQKRPLEG
jgi:DNA replication protein DnaC